MGGAEDLLVAPAPDEQMIPSASRSSNVEFVDLVNYLGVAREGSKTSPGKQCCQAGRDETSRQDAMPPISPGSDTRTHAMILFDIDVFPR